jgi:predicted phosphodiesterase
MNRPRTLFSLILLSLTCASATAQERFLIDLGPAGRTSSSPDTLGRHWNNMTAPGAGSAQPLLTSDGDSSSATFTVTDTFPLNSLNGHASTVAVYPYSASSDFWSTTKADQKGVIRIGGLDTTGAKVYDFTLFGSSSRPSPQKLIADYTVKGVTTKKVTLEAVGNINNTVMVSGIQADWRGNIAIEVALNPGAYSSATEAYGVLGVVDIQTRLETRPPAEPPAYWAMGSTPNPPQEVSAENPEALTAYVLESKDTFSKRVGLGELLRRAGFHVKPLPLHAPPFDTTPGSDFNADVDLIAIGSFASGDPDYTAYMAAYGELLDDYIDRAGLLIHFTQADQTEPSPPFLPDTQNAVRDDTDFSKALILNKDHLMMKDLPTVDNGNAIELILWDEPTNAFTNNTIWESFNQFFGFNVILAADSKARNPGFMEGAYGQGRFFVSAMANDKILDPDTQTLTETPSLRAFNDIFFRNLYDYTALVRDRATPAISITPQPGTSIVPEGAWSIVLLPDTQIYSQNYPGLFEAQTAWIADNVRTRNIKFVLHLGDITNVNSIPEWEFARKAMKNLDRVIPYAVVPGNHDYGPGGNASTRDTHLNNYFKVQDYTAWPTFGGVKDAGKMDNTYHLFSAGGVDFIVIALEWAVRNDTIAWAQSILDQYPDRKAILLTHAYMNNNDYRYDHTDTTRSQTYNPHDYTTPGPVNDGQELWDKLVKKNNFAFTFNGHVLGDGTGFRIDNNDAGHPVAQMLANYQMRALGGESYLRILEFQPDNKTVKVSSYAPIYNNYLTAVDQAFEFEIPLGAVDLDNDGIFDYYDEDFDDDNDGLSNYYEHTVSGTSSKTADTDGDGISDAQEVALGTNPSQSEKLEFDAVLNHPNNFDLFTEQQLTDMRPDDLLIKVVDGEVKLNFQMEESGDLRTWSPAGEKVEWVFPADQSFRFYRLRMEK